MYSDCTLANRFFDVRTSWNREQLRCDRELLELAVAESESLKAVISREDLAEPGRTDPAEVGSRRGWPFVESLHQQTDNIPPRSIAQEQCQLLLRPAASIDRDSLVVNTPAPCLVRSTRRPWSGAVAHARDQYLAGTGSF